MGKKIGLYCGHGLSTNGLWDSGTNYKGKNEADLMFDITKSAVKYCRKSGLEVFTDIDNGNRINSVKQVENANRHKVEIYISIHCDWHKASSGTMPLYSSEKGKELAIAINKAVMKDMKIKTHGERLRKDLYELNTTNMPACIFETGSIDDDIGYFEQYDKYGKAIAKGICKYLGVKFQDGSFKVKAKGDLIVRRTASLTSKKTRKLYKGHTYTIVDTNKNKTRGKLKNGDGWITITDKYVEKI